MKARIVMIIMAVALVALPTMAQQDQWKSTSTMQGSGKYVAPVTAVGATAATPSYSPAKAPGPRKVETIGGEGESGGSGGSGLVNPGDGDPGSPIGDAVLPLMAFAMLFGGVIYLRRKRAAKS